MDYLGHQVSFGGLEAHPKDLGSLVNTRFPRSLRSMQSFLGSLNYFSRFIENFSIYASVLYELREADLMKLVAPINWINPLQKLRTIAIEMTKMDTSAIELVILRTIVI